MAEWVERLAVPVAAVVAAFVAVAYALPREVTVTRSADIAAPPAAIFALVGDLRRHGDWSPWLTGDPKMAITFTGPLDGVGQTMEWASARPHVASGRQTITRIEPDSAVEMAVGLDKRAATTWFSLVPGGGGGATVTWGFKTDLGTSPFARYFGLSLDGAVGPDLERGLARLKALAERPNGG